MDEPRPLLDLALVVHHRAAGLSNTLHWINLSLCVFLCAFALVIVAFVLT
jgi:hypothetical protein